MATTSPAGTVLAVFTDRPGSLVRWLVAATLLSSCIDPRIPTLPDPEPDVNLPPLILLDEIQPGITPLPVTVDVGEGCATETFAISLFDDDLAPGSTLSYRFNMTAQIGQQQTPPEVLFQSTLANPPSGTPGASFEVSPLLITPTMLNSAFFGRLEDLKEGQTHLLEFYVTDDPTGFVDAQGAEVREGYGRDSVHWLITIVQSNCAAL